MLIAFMLTVGVQPVVDRVAPSWLAMRATTFGVLLAIWIPASRAPAPVFEGAKGAIVGTLASLFVLEPEGSAVVAGLIGILVGTMTALAIGAMRTGHDAAPYR